MCRLCFISRCWKCRSKQAVGLWFCLIIPSCLGFFFIKVLLVYSNEVKSAVSRHFLQRRFGCDAVTNSTGRRQPQRWLNKDCLVIYSKVLQWNICREKNAVSPEEAFCYWLVNILLKITREDKRAHMYAPVRLKILKRTMWNLTSMLTKWYLA